MCVLIRITVGTAVLAVKEDWQRTTYKSAYKKQEGGIWRKGLFRENEVRAASDLRRDISAVSTYTGKLHF